MKNLQEFPAAALTESKPYASEKENWMASFVVFLAGSGENICPMGLPSSHLKCHQTPGKGQLSSASHTQWLKFKGPVYP